MQPRIPNQPALTHTQTSLKWMDKQIHILVLGYGKPRGTPSSQSCQWREMSFFEGKGTHKTLPKGKAESEITFYSEGLSFSSLKHASEAVVRMKTVAESQGMTAQGWMDLTWRVVETTCRVLKSEVILRWGRYSCLFSSVGGWHGMLAQTMTQGCLFTRFT